MAKGTILVVGGAGYIGSQTAKELKGRGFEPLVLDDLSTGHNENVRWGPLIQGSCGDAALLDKLFSQHRIAGVMHFAAYALVGESVTDPAKYYRNNVAATSVLLEAVAKHQAGPFIFSSTAATFGEPKTIPIPEDHPQEPINPYGRTKLIVERMLADFDSAYGLKYAALRYFNAAGADPDGETGEKHDPESHLIPRAILSVLGKLDGLQIFGTDYDTPDGTCVRDYIHTVDLAAAHILALEKLLGKGDSCVYNLGNGEGRSVRQVLDAVQEVSGVKLEVKEGPRRPGDPPRLVASSEKAKTELGWKPKYADLKTIVRHAWNWHRKG